MQENDGQQRRPTRTSYDDSPTLRKDADPDAIKDKFFDLIGAAGAGKKACLAAILAIDHNGLSK